MGGDWAARGEASAGGASGSGASPRDASATSKTVPQPPQRAFRPGTSSFSGGTRMARRHFGQSTVMWSHLPVVRDSGYLWMDMRLGY
jgi:hypothetical protein